MPKGSAARVADGHRQGHGPGALPSSISRNAAIAVRNGGRSFTTAAHTTESATRWHSWRSTLPMPRTAAHRISDRLAFMCPGSCFDASEMISSPLHRVAEQPIRLKGLEARPVRRALDLGDDGVDVLKDMPMVARCHQKTRRADRSMRSRRRGCRLSRVVRSTSVPRRSSR